MLLWLLFGITVVMWFYCAFLLIDATKKYRNRNIPFLKAFILAPASLLATCIFCGIKIYKAYINKLPIDRKVQSIKVFIESLTHVIIFYAPLLLILLLTY
ncbi:MAG: hypothetical protein U9O65_10155 [Thermotogota bacterium]|nr:hypothetical protein [Thermotogota bacterium]